MNSNLFGKSLEFAVANGLICKGFKLSKESQKIYDNYEKKWNILSKHKQNDFKNFFITLCESNLLSNLLSISFNNEIENEFELLSDNNGKKSDVTDILIKPNIRLSIKNNKIYNKSHRPSAFGKQAGLDDYNKFLYDYAYSEIIDRFWNMYKFHSIFKTIGSENIKNELYEPIYELTIIFLHLLSKDEINYYYQFLTGIEPHYQCINMPDKVLIYDYTNFNFKPDKIKIRRTIHNYLIIDFTCLKSNEISSISMRLHTASSKITKNISIKFDVQIISNKLIPETLAKQKTK